MPKHHWVVLQRLRFAAPIAAASRTFPRPEGPHIWRFCPAQVLDEDGLPTSESDVWGGMAVFDDEATARAHLDAPDRLIPWLDEAEESWFALAIPYAHHGSVDWRDGVETDCALIVSAARPEGPVAVVTSAGYAAPPELDRVKAFLGGVDRARAYYRGLDQNLRADVFNGGQVDGREGMTLTLWPDSKAMIGAAYKTGEHRSQMDVNEATALFDRSSFSRFIPLESRGSWDGDPFAANPLARAGETRQ